MSFVDTSGNPIDPNAPTSVSELVVTAAKRFQPATFWTGKRFFGPITALMTVDERGADRLTITQHPVELGAEITDHAYMEPAELNLRMMATNSGQAAGAGGDDYVTNLYTQLRKLQVSREVFPIQTGKRLYEHMLITSLEVTTDEKSEYALMLSIQCKEIIIVQTRTVLVGQLADQTNPAKTGSVTASGTKQAQPSTETVPANPLESGAISI